MAFSPATNSTKPTKPTKSTKSARALTKIDVNSHLIEVEVMPDQSLLSVLRDTLDLTGTKYGCGEGQCGACTVLIDGHPTRSCITSVGSVGKRTVTTVEGLEKNGRMTEVQEAFIECDALQCGYCTSGMIMSATALLQRIPSPTEAQIIEAMQGNICRCGTYRRIIRAIQKAAGESKKR